MSLAELESLYREGLERDDQGPAYKTVATFAGLTQKKIWLKDGATPMTDGHEIQAPFKDPYFYRLVEHELAHILFESNTTARSLFIARYIETTQESLQRNQLPLLDDDQRHALKSLLSTVVGLVEDARVESLWGMLYPGSYALMQDMAKSRIPSKLVQAAHRSLESFLIVSSTGIETPDGQFSKYEPPLKEALKKVERRGFTATLIVSKWLVTKLVNEALKPYEIHKAQKKLAPSLAQQVLSKQTAPLPASSNDGDVTSENEAAPSVLPPVSMADLQARRRALSEVLATGDNTLSTLISIPTDWSEKKFPPGAYETSEAKRMVKAAMELKPTDEAMATFLAHSEKKMAERVEEILEALGQQMEVDGWITKNALAKVNLRDVRGSSAVVLSAEDNAAMNRLRSLFFKVMCRKKWMLYEAGTAIDVGAYVGSRLSGQSEPCFRVDEPGRGFKVLVLLDRSSSMKGEKTEQAERACRVLSQALRFPFVDFHVWGFQSHNSALDLTRFDRATLAFSGKDSKVGGHTPLHIALRVAVRFMTMGDEAKQIIIITDGWPSHSNARGRWQTKTLRRFVREEVLTARRIGMNVTGVVIGNDMNDEGLSHMLGPPTNWKRMNKHALGAGLVQVVSSSFTKYLRNG